MYHVGENFLKKELQQEMDVQVDQFGSLHGIYLDVGGGLNLKNDSLEPRQTPLYLEDNVLTL